MLLHSTAIKLSQVVTSQVGSPQVRQGPAVYT